MDLQNNIKCVIFDLDGTLAKFPINYDLMRQELKDYFKKENLFSEFMPLIPSIKRLSSKTSSPKKTLKSALKIVERQELLAVENAIPNKKIIQLYLKSFSLNKKVVILTRNSRPMVNRFIELFDLKKPHLIVAREDIENMKPHLDHIKPVFRRFHFEKKEYLLIGDSSHDEELAIKAKINFKRV